MRSEGRGNVRATQTSWMTSLGVVLGYQPQIVATQVLDLYLIYLILIYYLSMIMTHVEFSIFQWTWIGNELAFEQCRPALPCSAFPGRKPSVPSRRYPELGWRTEALLLAALVPQWDFFSLHQGMASLLFRQALKYPAWWTNILPWKIAIEMWIFPLKMVIFHGKMLVHQRVDDQK